MTFLGASTLPGVGTAVSAGAVYGYVMGFVVCGDGAEMAVRALYGGGGIRHRPDHSHAQTLEQRGELEGALAAYRRALRDDPTDLLPYLGAARVLERKGEAKQGVEALREALARARLSPQQEVLVLQRLASLWEEVGRREGAAPDLARYLEAHPDGPGAPWARRELADIKAALARSLGLDGRERGSGPGPDPPGPLPR